MKKLTVLAVLAIGLAFNSYAQQTTWGVRGGLNISNACDKYTGSVSNGDSKSDYEEDFKSRVGFHLGVILDWGLCENFYIQPGLYYTTRGAKLKEDGGTLKFNASYLQLPILASYRFALGENSKLHINAGPYLAYGLGGKTKLEAGAITLKGDTFKVTKEDAEISDGINGGMKRFDAGLNFGAGISIQKIYFGLNYDLGLTNIADKDQWSDDYKIRNRNFSISVGYNF